MAITFANKAKSINAATSAADFSACNATGLLIAMVGGFDVATFSDSSGNTWIPGTTFTDPSGGILKAYYVVHPTATASQTFSWNGSFYSLVVLGFSNVSAFDQQSGANGDVSQPGALTPTTDGTSLFVAGYGGGSIVTASVNAPFTLADSNNYGAGVNYSSAAAYYIQTSAGAQNPT